MAALHETSLDRAGAHGPAAVAALSSALGLLCGAPSAGPDVEAQWQPAWTPAPALFTVAEELRDRVARWGLPAAEVLTGAAAVLRSGDADARLAAMAAVLEAEASLGD
jgi:hypothetical protein